MRSNHTAILTSFKIKATKFKVNEKVVSHIHCNIIGYQNLNIELFHNSLSESIADGTTYSNYNKNVVEASTNTTTITNQKKQWLVPFQMRLPPSID